MDSVTKGPAAVSVGGAHAQTSEWGDHDRSPLLLISEKEWIPKCRITVEGPERIKKDLLPVAKAPHVLKWWVDRTSPEFNPNACNLM